MLVVETMARATNPSLVLRAVLQDLGGHMQGCCELHRLDQEASDWTTDQSCDWSRCSIGMAKTRE